jgi:hypothetical protein
MPATAHARAANQPTSRLGVSPCAGWHLGRGPRSGIRLGRVTPTQRTQGPRKKTPSGRLRPRTRPAMAPPGVGVGSSFCRRISIPFRGSAGPRGGLASGPALLCLRTLNSPPPPGVRQSPLAPQLCLAPAHRETRFHKNSANNVTNDTSNADIAIEEPCCLDCPGRVCPPVGTARSATIERREIASCRNQLGSMGFQL